MTRFNLQITHLYATDIFINEAFRTQLAGGTDVILSTSDMYAIAPTSGLDSNLQIEYTDASDAGLSYTYLNDVWS